jgi:hypothetical protein
MFLKTSNKAKLQTLSSDYDENQTDMDLKYCSIAEESAANCKLFF